jgi:Zn-dependent oligopeptidase
MLLEKQRRRELLKELSQKKLENSRRWRELRQEELNKKCQIFQKKYELRKKRLDLETYKLGKKRRKTTPFENTLENRMERIENYLKL